MARQIDPSDRYEVSPYESPEHLNRQQTNPNAYRLSCAGLSPHEASMVRLVQQGMAERLERPWRVVTDTRADLILVDPKTERGQATVEAVPSHAKVLVLLDRGAPVPAYADQPLYRPFRPTGLVEVLNAYTEPAEQPVSAA